MQKKRTSVGGFKKTKNGRRKNRGNAGFPTCEERIEDSSPSTQSVGTTVAETVVTDSESVSNEVTTSEEPTIAETNTEGTDGDPTNADGDEPSEDATTTAEPSNSGPERAKKLSVMTMRNLIAEFFCCDGSVNKFVKEKKLESHCRAFLNHWNKSGLEELKKSKSSLFEVLNKHDSWAETEKKKRADKNVANGSKEKALPEEFECFLSMLICQLAMFGTGIGKKATKSLLEGVLKEHETSERQSAFSHSTVDRFMRRCNLAAKEVKNMDPMRASQVTQENRVAMFATMDSIVQLCHAVDPIHCPWKKWEEVPARNKHNVDEMAADPTKHRNRIALKQKTIERIFQVTPQGDRMIDHITLVVFSRADGCCWDGVNGIDGAPMPMIIHADRSAKQPALTNRQQRIALCDTNENTLFDFNERFLEGFSPDNALGLTVRATKNGSMEKDTFLDAMIHFTDHLPDDQGADGEWAFLGTDSHVSRWNPKALLWLFEHRVVPFMFPSHLSVHVQPQDNGVALSTHNKVADAEELPRLFHADSSVAALNMMIEEALQRFRSHENNLKRLRGTNSAARAWGQKTGLEPAEQNCPGWREATRTFGAMNRLKIQNGNGELDTVAPKDANNRPDFTPEDAALFEAAVPNTARNPERRSIVDEPLTKSCQLAWDAIDCWVEEDQRTREAVPCPKTAAQRAAIKHVDVHRVISAELSGAKESFASSEDRNKARIEGLIRAAKRRDVVEARHVSDDSFLWCNATKLDSGNWMVVGGEDATKCTTSELLGESWIINPDQRADLGSVEENADIAGRGKCSHRRARREKDEMITRLAKLAGDDERERQMKHRFDSFDDLPHDKRTCEAFKCGILEHVQQPSHHRASVVLDGEEHTLNVAANEQGSAAMEELITKRVVHHLTQKSDERAKKQEEKKKKREKGGVAKVRKGSDGFRKVQQMDEQHQQDLTEEETEQTKQRETKVAKPRAQWMAIVNFVASTKKNEIWDSIWSTEAATTDVLVGDALNGNEAGLILQFKVKGWRQNNKAQKRAIVNGLCLAKQAFWGKIADTRQLMRDLGIACPAGGVEELMDGNDEQLVDPVADVELADDEAETRLERDRQELLDNPTDNNYSRGDSDNEENSDHDKEPHDTPADNSNLPEDSDELSKCNDKSIASNRQFPLLDEEHSDCDEDEVCYDGSDVEGDCFNDSSDEEDSDGGESDKSDEPDPALVRARERVNANQHLRIADLNALIRVKGDVPCSTKRTKLLDQWDSLCV